MTYGLLLGGFGMGAIVGVVLNPRVRSLFSNETVVRLAFVFFAIGASGVRCRTICF